MAHRRDRGAPWSGDGIAAATDYRAVNAGVRRERGARFVVRPPGYREAVPELTEEGMSAPEIAE